MPEPTEGKPIKHQTQIVVTQENIDRSIKGNSAYCMISDAIRHSNGNAKSISTDLQTIRWTDRRNSVRYVWLTPAIAQEALVKFDQGLPFGPFTFRLGHPIAETAGGHLAPRGAGRPRKSRRRVRVRRGGKGAISVTTEGHALPPVAALPGSRRRFGLKQLKIGLFDDAPTGGRKKSKA